MNLIGLVGFIGSGKGTVGECLVTNGYHHDSFAAPIKDAASSIFGWNRALLEGDTDASRTWREQPDVFWSKQFDRTFTPREALQKLGTEAGRNVFHADLWVSSLLRRTQGKNTVVTDVRFKNEIVAIQKAGGLVVRVKRGSEPSWYGVAQLANSGDPQALLAMEQSSIHRSEWDWIGCEVDYTLDNSGTLEALSKEINTFLNDVLPCHEVARLHEVVRLHMKSFLNNT